MAQVARHDARIAGPPGPIFDWSMWKKAATAQVYQTDIGGVGWTIACNEFGVIIGVPQLSGLNTDQIVINAAIVYANSVGGGSVFVDVGGYNLGANVVLLSYVYLYGSGAGTVLTIPAATDDCIEVNGVIDWKIAFMTLRTSGAGANDVISLVNADNGEIFSVIIDDSGQDGIIIDADSSDVAIHDNKISNCIRYGINNLGDDMQIMGNRIDTTGNDGIWLQAGGTYCVVTENRVSGWVGEGIDSDEPTNNLGHNITNV